MRKVSYIFPGIRELDNHKLQYVLLNGCTLFQKTLTCKWRVYWRLKLYIVEPHDIKMWQVHDFDSVNHEINYM